MKAAQLLNTRAAMVAVGVVLVAAVAYFAVKKFSDAAGEAADDYNAGTPYASGDLNPVQTGVATLGHAVDDLSGNLLSTFGGWLGRSFYDLTTPAYDPNK